MAVKTVLTREDFESILSKYTLGTFIQSEPVQQGSVQTNFFIQTTQGKFVLRYYENRSQESALFESDLLAYLAERHYPCPVQFKTARGAYVSLYRNKPLAIFELMIGQLIEQPGLYHWQQLIQKAAELQKLTANYRPQYTSHRWNYTADLCQTLARAEVEQIDTQDAREKFAWLAHELTTLDLPSSLPKGICHCDFHFSNVLFQGDELVALLDFDDANYTFLQFDLVGLIEYWAWPHTAVALNLTKARRVAQEYMKHRSLPLIEQRHLFDIYKLSILFDCVWFFARGTADNFYEKRKIDVLNSLGRQRFFDALFHK